MSIIVFIAIDCMIDSKIITIIAIIAIIHSLQDSLPTVHVRLHALDLLHEIHS